MNNNIDTLEFWTRRKIIPIFGVINEENASNIIKALYSIHFEYEDTFVPVNKRKVVIILNSPGGLVSAGLAIYDTIKILPLTVYTICSGTCASMGAFLLSSGENGKRYAFANAEIMMHQPLGGASGQASDIKIIADHILKTKQRLNSILSENTGRSYQEIEKDTDRDNFFTAEQAKEYGIIDHVITQQNLMEVLKYDNTWV